MYDELVKALRGFEDYDGLDFLENRTYAQDIAREAADAIEELNAIREEQKAQIVLMAEEDKPRWIPVTERLPGSGVPTLICGDGNVVEQGFFDDEYDYWYDWGGNRTFVHHWMPLPEPPKEVKTDGQ